MNINIIRDLKKEYQRVEIVRYQGKSTYANCINEYELDYDKLNEIIKNTEYGEVTITDEKIIVCRKIKN